FLALVQDELADAYQILKEFKEYRLACGGPGRDPALRIVVLSEKYTPRGNWSQLGIYELMTGPVLPNVLSYKLSRHYHKALAAEENAAEIPLIQEVDLVEACEGVKKEDKGWQVFRSKPEVKQKTVKAWPVPDELKNVSISVKVRLPFLDASAGEWICRETADDTGDQWDWKNKTGADEEQASQGWAFAGEAPTYDPRDKSWQLKGESPRLYRWRKSTTPSPLEEPFMEWADDPKTEGRLRAKKEVEVQHAKKNIYGAPPAKPVEKPRPLGEALDGEKKSSFLKPIAPAVSFQEAMRKRVDVLKKSKSAADPGVEGLRESEASAKTRDQKNLRFNAISSASEKEGSDITQSETAAMRAGKPMTEPSSEDSSSKRPSKPVLADEEDIELGKLRGAQKETDLAPALEKEQPSQKNTSLGPFKVDSERGIAGGAIPQVEDKLKRGNSEVGGGAFGVDKAPLERANSEFKIDPESEQNEKSLKLKLKAKSEQTKGTLEDGPASAAATAAAENPALKAKVSLAPSNSLSETEKKSIADPKPAKINRSSGLDAIKNGSPFYRIKAEVENSSWSALFDDEETKAKRALVKSVAAEENDGEKYRWTFRALKRSDKKFGFGPERGSSITPRESEVEIAEKSFLAKLMAYLKSLSKRS
ncbi:MAG: hypothetical protein H7333_01810, partial [Bdellovibrionales bacterium]|nr:hypothetical protein [Oligoflexia bacterium]